MTKLTSLRADDEVCCAAHVSQQAALKMGLPQDAGKVRACLLCLLGSTVVLAKHLHRCHHMMICHLSNY